MAERGFNSIDYANADLYSGMNGRPSSAIPLEIPMKNLQPKPDGSPNLVSPGEKALIMEEQAARREAFRQEQLQNQAREEEIYKREQARRDEIAKRTKPAQPEEPRITNRNPAWENPTPSRQPSASSVSPATPAPTPNTSGARSSPLVDVLTPPAPAELKQPLPGPDPSPTAKPSSLPSPAGLAGTAAGGAVVDTAFRLIAGQSPGQAIVGGIGSGIGTAAGVAAGSLAGPIGSFVGGAIGGFIGGRIADAIYNAVFPSPAQPKSDPKQAPPPFNGGQGKGVYYKVTIKYDIFVYGNYSYTSTATFYVYGPILEVALENPYRNSPGSFGAYIIAYNAQGNQEYETAGHGGYANGGSARNARDIQVSRVDNKVDIDGDPSSNPIPADQRSPNSTYHPGNYNYVPPSAYPAAGQKPAPNNYVPGGISNGGTSRGDQYDWIPHAGLAPKQNPNPSTTPNNLGGNLPSIVNNPSPNPSPNTDEIINITFDDSPGGNFQINNTAFPRSGPAQSTANFGDVVAQPIPIDSSPKFIESTLKMPSSQPSSLPTTAKQTTPEDGVKPQPPASNPTTQNNQDTEKKYDDLTKQIQDQGLTLITITEILKKLQKDTPNKQEVEETVKSGVCSTLQPGACGNKALNDAANDIKNNTNNNTANILGAINAGANAAQLALLQVIDNKLGPQLPGGISKFLEDFLKRFNKVAQWLHLDRILNVLIWWQTLHNAAMLSNNIFQTLASGFNNLLALIGIKDAEGDPLDIGAVLGKSYEEAVKSALGEETYKNLNAAWNAANRIYQAAANIASLVQSIQQSILSALEVIGAGQGKIANALKAAGTVFENAYEWFNTQPNFDNALFRRLEKFQQKASNIELVTQTPLDVKSSVASLKEEKNNMASALKDGEEALKGLGVIESENEKKKADEGKQASQGKDLESVDKIEADD